MPEPAVHRSPTVHLQIAAPSDRRPGSAATKPTDLVVGVAGAQLAAAKNRDGRAHRRRVHARDDAPRTGRLSGFLAKCGLHSAWEQICESSAERRRPAASFTRHIRVSDANPSGGARSRRSPGVAKRFRDIDNSDTKPRARRFSVRDVPSRRLDAPTEASGKKTRAGVRATPGPRGARKIRGRRPRLPWNARPAGSPATSWSACPGWRRRSRR